ncbi:MAG: RecQ family ATP-dependent DNA helicase [Myxococcota bacterium]
MNDALDLDAGLEILGLRGFRAGQREAIDTLLRERRLLLVAPTGGGKSLCYQLPATLLPGTTLVISPLIALMHDQVTALEARGVAATYLASTLEPAELQRRTERLLRGRYRLAYLAPERLARPGFRARLKELDVSLVAVDEAHCISEWGHDFRPDYLQIGDLLAMLPRARVLACTATATPVVRDEILARLGLDASTPQMLRGFARPNLSLRAALVTGRADRRARADAALAEALGSPGARRGTAILYAPTRKATEEEALRLASLGWAVRAYHAGLPARDRDASQRAFSSGELEVIVATNAFGMGIDRRDVRAVIHLGPPGSLEAYYQEVGRAGRDGADALGLLLYSPQDLPLRRRLIESGTESSPDEIRHRWELFLELMRWAEGGSCRHDAILRYFGDEAETLSGCGRCDVCSQISQAPQAAGEVENVVRKALSAVARIHGRFGMSAAVKLLRGDPDPRLERSGLEQTRTFGILSRESSRWLTQVLQRAVTAGWVDFSSGDRPVVQLTSIGLRVMRGELPPRLLLPPRTQGPSVGPPSPGAPRLRRPAPTAVTAVTGEDAPTARERELFEALRAYRLERSRAAGVPPYVIASDRTLRDVARLRPGTLEELEQAHGIGPARARRYGAGLLEVVARATSGSLPARSAQAPPAAERRRRHKRRGGAPHRGRARREPPAPSRPRGSEAAAGARSRAAVAGGDACRRPPAGSRAAGSAR